MRTTRESVTFDTAFRLDEIEGSQPAGTYEVDVDEELIDGLSFIAYRRLATTIYLPLRGSGTGSIQALTIDPRQLEGRHRVILSRDGL